MNREKLIHLRVDGFRSLRQLDLPLGDLTVLVGSNGSGKSNLVDFFNMLHAMLCDRLQLYISQSGGASAFLHYGPQRTPNLTADLVVADERGRSEYGFRLAFASPDRMVFTDEHVKFHKMGQPRPYSKTLGVGQVETDLLALAGRKESSTARTVARVFLNRLRGLQVYHFHDTSEKAPIRLYGDIERNRHLLSNAGNLAAVLYMLQQAHPTHFERILATARLAVPYLRELVLAPDAVNPERIMLRWRDRNPAYEFGPHQLSDGSLRAIALVTALLQPEELLPPVIVIDEPELGLHPSAVGLIGQLIKAASSKRQVIVATQSSRLLKEFAPEDIVVIEREEDETGHGESRFERLTKDALGDWLEEYDLGALHEMNVTGGGPR